MRFKIKTRSTQIVEAWTLGKTSNKWQKWNLGIVFHKEYNQGDFGNLSLVKIFKWINFLVKMDERQSF